MATYTSNQVASGLVRGNWRGADFTIFGSVEVSSAAVGDVYQLARIPNGYSVESVTIGTDKLDSNATPTLVFEVGDPTTPNQFITGSTAAQTGGVQYSNVGAGVGKIYPLGNDQTGQSAGGNAGSTILQAQVTTAAATFSAGTMRCAVRCYLDPQLGGFT
jgi:hypothetical protein